jgi:crotonobetainyl-CoA:carnitine CoA-transferase CaiB-like acyl-CoA transferase
MRQALDGIRVVELAQEPAGQYCGKAFGDLGADVVKVEPPTGDPVRSRMGRFLHLNTNKRSMVVDPDDAEGQYRVEQLLAGADVVIQTHHMGDLAGFGLSADILRLDRPALVVATISGYGLTGPYSDYRWTDLTAQMLGWWLYPQGPATSRPLKLPGILGLCSLGHMTGLAALAAVVGAERTGVGADIDIAAYESHGTAPSRVGRFLGWEHLGRPPSTPIATATGDMLIPTGIFPCGDGFVSMMSTPQQLPEMLEVLDDDELKAAFARPDAFARGETKEILDAALYPWLLSHTRAELTEQAQAAGWPFAGLYSPAEVRAASHLHQRGFWIDVEDPRVGRVQLTGAPYRLAEGGWKLRRRAPLLGEHDHEVEAELAAATAEPEQPRVEVGADASSPVLGGIRVLDFTTVWSGPYLTQLLADLGAEVIRVENPSVFPPTTKGYLPRPDPSMQLGGLLSGYAPPNPDRPDRPDRPYNRHGMNNSLARNKLSCTIDPRCPEGLHLLHQLVAQSDVVVENLKMSTFHRLGLQEGQLLDINPRLIILRIPPAGLTGDWADYTGFGAQFDGLTGLAYLMGHHDSELVETPATTTMDATTCASGGFALLAALRYRERTGRGQVIELAQMENVMCQMGDIYLDDQLGIEPIRMGNRDHVWAPQGVYQCDKPLEWIGISVTSDDEWKALAELVGGSDLAADPRYATAEQRREHHDGLDQLLEAWTRQRDSRELFHELQAKGIPAAPELDEAMLVEDPHVAERAWLRPITTTDTGTFLQIGHAFKGVPQVWDRGSPALGEDNEYVFRKLLHLDDDEYERLVQARVIGEDYLDANGVPV